MATTPGPEPAPTAAERVLLARLDYNRAKRRRPRLELARAGTGSVHWFSHRVAGIPIGLHEGVLLANTEAAALDELLDAAEQTGSGIFKITRPTVSAGGPPARFSTPRWSAVRRADRARELLPLLPSYDETLASLGRHARRNVRLARRRAEAERFRFEASTAAPLVSTAERTALARQTSPRPIPTWLLNRLEAYVDGVGRPFRTAVRAPDGRVVSYACGYFGTQDAYLVFQLNDNAWNELGPSLLHRAFLLEWLVERSCRELVFVHGCSGVLFHSCVRHAYEEVWVMRRTHAARLRTAAIGALQPNTSIGRLARLALDES